MVQTVKFGKQIHNFPDEATPEMIAQALGISGIKEPMQSAVGSTDLSEIPSRLRDIAGGMAGGLQRTAVGLGEAGQAIASKITGGYAPQVNIREELGLGQERPVDLQKMISSKNPDPIASTIGQVGVGLLAGGRTLPGQVATNAAYGAAQAEPDQQNLFGLLPSGRVGAAIEGGALPLIPGALGLGFKGVSKTSQGIKNVLAPVDLKKTAKLLQSNHDVQDKVVREMYSNIEKEVLKRNIKNISIDPKLIDEASKYMPKTEASRLLINKAKTGNYVYLRKLQSDLDKRARKFSSSGLGSEELLAEEAWETRSIINSQIENHLFNTGNRDLSQELTNADEKFKSLRRLYFNKDLPVGIKKLVNPDRREIPKDTLSVLSVESEPMKAIMEANPQVAQNLESYVIREKRKKLARILGKGTLFTGVGATGAKSIYDYLRK